MNCASSDFIFLHQMACAWPLLKFLNKLQVAGESFSFLWVKWIVADFEATFYCKLVGRSQVEHKVIYLRELWQWRNAQENLLI